nr:tetratricopeptide repeat protein [uncultured Celeribacter sp.]
MNKTVGISDFQRAAAIARKLGKEGRYMEAAIAYAQAAKIDPGSKAGIFVALSLRDAGKTKEAVAVFAKYAKDHPDDVDGWVGLGTLLKRLERYSEAILPLQKALSMRDEVTIRNTYIACLWRTGRLKEAQLQGLRNLNDKHRNALRTFDASPFRDMKLSPGGRGFDPDHREKNIISFSLWGNRPEYVTGAIVNAQIAQHIYVRWTARFYCDASVPEDARNALKAYGAQVVMMTRPEHQKYRPMWRFLASDDRDINVFVCRDADSRLNAKELLAVQAWLDSGKRFHVMRDHIYHHELILAGMWGAMAGVLPPMADWLRSAERYFDNKFGDQAFLADFVWPMIQDDVCVHDSYYAFPHGTPFPKGYDLPGQIHVGGSAKRMPHWSTYVQMPG